MSDYGGLHSADISNLWHPYTEINTFEKTDFPIIERAEGIYLFDVSGHRMLDGISSWWCVNLGHGHPRIVAALTDQIARLQNCITGGMSHTGVIRLSEKLVSLAPEGLDRAYFASDGACAVEAALRIAIQYWWNQGRPQKREMVSLESGYHGDTLGAVGLGYIDRFHRPVKHILKKSLKAFSPHCFHCPCGMRRESCDIECFESMRDIIEKNRSRIAAVIVEPVCQGAAGMRIYPSEYIRRLRNVCDRNEVLLILDEIAVGFGRTGRMFSSDLTGISPDIMCLGKGLTAGYIPMSAVLVSETIYDSFRNTHRDRTFYHGHTYSGNPIASSAALAALDVYTEEKVIEQSSGPAAIMHKAFSDFRQIPGVHDSTAFGFMSSLEISEEAGGSGAAARVVSRAAVLGLLLRPLGPVIYLWPPLTTTETEMKQMIDIFSEALDILPC